MNDLLCELVEIGVVEEVDRLDGALGRHRRRHDFFRDIALIAVGERRTYVHKHLNMHRYTAIFYESILLPHLRSVNSNFLFYFLILEY